MMTTSPTNDASRDTFHALEIDARAPLVAFFRILRGRSRLRTTEDWDVMRRLSLVLDDGSMRMSSTLIRRGS